MSDNERIAVLEQKAKFYDQFFVDIKKSMDDLKDSILGLGGEMKKERKQEMQIIHGELENLKNDLEAHKRDTAQKVGWLAIFMDYKPLTIVLFLLYTALVIKESREMILSFLGLR